MDEQDELIEKTENEPTEKYPELEDILASISELEKAVERILEVLYQHRIV